MDCHTCFMQCWGLNQSFLCAYKHWAISLALNLSVSFSFPFFFFPLLCRPFEITCIYVCVGVSMPRHVCGGQTTNCLVESGFFTVWIPEDWTQIVKIGGESLYPLSHLMGCLFSVGSKMPRLALNPWAHMVLLPPTPEQQKRQACITWSFILFIK